MLDTAIKQMGGVGRWRTKEEGPLPEVVSRMKSMEERVVVEHGRLESIEDFQAALRKSFPNANVSLDSLTGLDIGDDMSVFTDNVRGKVFKDMNRLGNYYSKENPEAALDSIRGFSRALLVKALDDPETAKLVGRINLVKKDSPYTATAGIGYTNPLDTPITISFNPRMEVIGSTMDQNGMNYGSNLLAISFARRDVDRGSPNARGRNTGTLNNSDVQANAAQSAFHEWGHAQGIRNSINSEDKDSIEPAQKWVGDGQPYVGGEELQEWADWISAETSKLVATPEQQRQAMRMFDSLGFKNVDMSDAATVNAIYRAMALRYVRSNRVFDDFSSRSESLSDEDWDYIMISGYGNSDKEEALAEIIGMSEMAPELTKKMYPGFEDVELIKERISGTNNS